MNSYDYQAMDAIRRYHAKYGEYPRCIEATAKHRENVAQKFVIDEVSIPVVPLGTRDIVFHRLLVRNADISLEQAKCSTAEQFQRMGAKFARAGCLLLEPKQHWGQQNVPPFLFYSQIEVYAFGEQSAFDKTTVAEEPNQLLGD